MTLDVHTTTLLALAMAVGYVMVVAGLGKNALELRRRRKVCPSCGLDTNACGCG